MSFASNWHAVIVGINEDPIPDMRGTNGGSRNSVPFRIKPERGKVSENSSDSGLIDVDLFFSAGNKEACNVFHKHVAGSKDANDAFKLAPKA